MASPGITVDSRKLEKKLKQIRKDSNKAIDRAQRDAAKQTRTMVSRDVRKTLNLRARDVNREIRAKGRRGQRRIHISYRQTPAHRFIGFRGPNREGSARTKYVRVRFRRGGSPIRFRRGFMLRDQIAVQRKGRSRYPLEAITGPSVHGEAEAKKDKYAKNGRVIYRRRLRYWAKQMANKANKS